MAQAQAQRKGTGDGEAVTKRLSYEDFCKRAITKLRTDQSKGIHTVFSGFNTAFRQYYGEKSDPIAVVDKLVEQGKLARRYARKGAMLYLLADAPKPRTNESTAKATLGKMGL